jgi:predicted nucleic acid-binding protein
MVKVIVDTSILIDHLKKRSSGFITLVEKQFSGEIDIYIPFIAIVELFAGEDARQKKARDSMLTTIKGENLIGLTLTSTQIAGELIRKYKQIPDPVDLIIAAIAIEQEALIATKNRKHFQQIKEVKLFNS